MVPPSASAGASGRARACSRTMWLMRAGRAASRASVSIMRSSAGGLDHVAGNDDLLDLRGALVNAEQAHVPIKTLGRIFADVAGAAVDLHGAVGHAAAHLGGEQLAAGGLGGDVVAVVALAGGIEHHRFC